MYLTWLSDHALGWAWYVGLVAAVFFIIVLILLVFARPAGPSYDNRPYMMQAPPQAYPLTPQGAYPVGAYPPQPQPQPAYPQYPQSYVQPSPAKSGYARTVQSGYAPSYAPSVQSGYPPSYHTKAQSNYAPSAYSGYPPSYHTKAPSGYAQSQAPSYAYPQKYWSSGFLWCQFLNLIDLMLYMNLFCSILIDWVRREIHLYLWLI